MRKLILSVGFLFSFYSIISGQNNYQTRDSVHIFWQPDVQITFQDFKGDISPEMKDEFEKFNYSANASLGLWSVIDIPKKWKKKKDWDKYEKIYIAPAFEKPTSIAISDDSIQIAIQITRFDIHELWARWARRQFQAIKDSMMNSTGSQSIFYTTIIEDMKENCNTMVAYYLKDVIIDKKEGSFDEWKERIQQYFAETEEWATTPEECHRFIIQKPIEKGYVKAKKLIGPMPKSSVDIEISH
ncbi:hypothetical protein LJC16_02580 [Bacteroidales bacterium OttesenSCG-928-C19]|nr:hypothetical protein [Bacteroidales bacterium OttesenSCG-928-C19]